MAIGFSQNNKMPDTDVIGCQKSDATTAHVKDTYNNGYANSHDNDNSGIANVAYSINGSYFSCVFTRTYHSPDSNRGFSLNVTNYYIFLAVRSTGTFGASSSRFERHSFTPCITGPLDPLGPAAVTTRGTDYTLVRAHGMLMLLAWSVFIATGVFMASYTKFIFPNGEWFHAHKYINMLALLIALAGIVLIFVSVRGWKIEPEGSAVVGHLWAHQLIGLTSVLIMVINPIMAAFRCRPAARFRWVFQLFHRGLGYIGITLAAVAIALGLFLYYNLIGKQLNMAYGFWMYIGRLVTEWVFYIPLITYVIIKKTVLCKREKTEKEVPLPDESPIKIFFHNVFALPACPRGEDRKKPAREWPIIALVLVAFIVYTLAFYVATVVVVALSEQI